ncbi:FG-GAP-like repeat-containing protein [Paractinoplanes rishiriensis]|uniref:LamG-like jellyroll fold domain-containing protein n=1 Tax=Paractinoplanes rishiriensis TaxID=1050105 RepID=A0A919KBY2_9ACTN|nr:FG-GAP-like repeat-containing protein [Actinoplanes rishiriensis]GIF00647.1 hypothetical protein Ari01nite_81110 [Actinoplanes rishiriensis]
MTVERAIMQAHRTGQPVEATASASETTTVTAQPDGSVTLTQSAVPTRKKVDGEWRDLDPELVPNADGSWSPRLAGAPLRLSGGGDGPMAVLGAEKLNIALGAPAALRPPTIAGPTATYPDVFPGVDLQVTAKAAGGFSEVFVVHDADAAKDLATISLPLTTTGLTVAADSVGNLTGKDPAGRTIITAPAPAMWDSTEPTTPTRTDTAGIARDTATGRPATSTSGGPGAAARRAPMGAAVRDAHLHLTPDRAMLTAKTTRFPVYLDPTFNWVPAAGTFSGWSTVAKEFPTTNYWKDTPDPRGRMQSGNSDDVTSRTLINFGIPVSALAGGTINTALLKITETWSWSCIDSRVNLYAPSAVLASSNATWNYWVNRLGSVVDHKTVANGHSSSCPSAAIAFDVKDEVVANVTSGKKTQTFALAAHDESDHNGWKEFLETSPTLAITYNHEPNKPSGLRTSPATSCTAGNSIGEGPVSLYATVSDPNQGAVGVTFKLWKEGSSTPLVTTNPQNSYYTSGRTAVLKVPAATLASATPAGGTAKFLWQVQATDFGLPSDWSATCNFVYDRARPGAPGIDTPVEGSATIGQSITIPVAPPTGTVPVTYLYQLNGGPYGTINATSGAAEVTVTPTRFTNTLTVTSRSAGGNIGDTAAVTFNANPAETAIDADLDGDNLTDLLTIGGGNGLAAGLWLAPGKGDGRVAPKATNVGAHGTGIDTPGQIGGPTQFTGRQAITGHFSGTGIQDILAYNPADGRAAVLRGNGDGSIIQTQLSSTFSYLNSTTFRFTDFNDFQDINQPQQLVNAGAHSTVFPDLIGINSKPDGSHLLTYYASDSGVLGIYNGFALPNQTPTGGTDWNTWTLASAQTSTGTALFLWQAATGKIYLWNNVLLNTTTGALDFTPHLLSTNFHTGQTRSLYAADVNSDGTADLWTVGAGAAATAWLVSGLNTGAATGTVTAQTNQTVLTGTHAWMLNDHADEDTSLIADATHPAKDSIGTLNATGGARWNSGDLFDPNAKFTGTVDLATATTAVDTSNDFTVDLWARPDAAGGVVVSQDGVNTSAFKVYAEATTSSWRFAMSSADTATPTWTYANAPNGSFNPGVWTHITASFKKSTGVLDLHLNGKDVARAVHLSPWKATKKFRIGATQTPAGIAGHLTGQVAHVLTFNQVVIYDNGNRAIRDFDGDNKSDVLARHADGTLRLYRGNGAGGFRPGYATIAISWGNMSEVSAPGDFNGDGRPDIIGRYSDGVLRLYPGNGAGGLMGGWTQIATSWGAMSEIFSPGDFNGDGKPDIIGRYSDGTVRLYAGNGTGGIASTYTTVATAWGNMNDILSPGDFNNDGKPDIIARYNDGVLRLYLGNGTGGINSSTYNTLATGWTSMSLLFSPGDFTGDTHPDIAGRYTDGTLRLYLGTATGTLISTSYKQIGTGWNNIPWAS